MYDWSAPFQSLDQSEYLLHVIHPSPQKARVIMTVNSRSPGVTEKKNKNTWGRGVAGGCSLGGGRFLILSVMTLFG